MDVICPTCSETVTMTATADPQADLACPRCGSVFDPHDATSVRGEAGPGAPDEAILWDRLVPAPGPDQSDLPEIPGYKVLEHVARGGCGMVLKARHLALDRLVAIKMLLPRNLDSASARERFFREARSAARLRHANICSIHEVGEHQGRPYLAMDFIQGPTLRKWARAQQPSARAAAEMVAKIARAVAAAHEQGVVHRDIKPDNVLIDAKTGEPVLTDFGLAKNLSDEPAANVTRVGTVMGTPAYMAPEQAAGHIDSIGPATDVYALGGTLYELLCGRPPFLGSAGEILRKVQTDEPTPPRKISPRIHRDVETICLKALAKPIAGRYASAAELADDLERFAKGEPILARRASIVARLARRIRRNPVAAAATLAAVLALLLVVLTAGQAVRFSRINAATERFETALGRTGWQAEDLAAMDAILAEVANLSPQRAKAAGEKLSRKLAAHIEQQVARPALDPTDFARIEQWIHALARRSESDAARMRAALAKRRGQWHDVVDLAGVLGDLARQVPSPGVRADGNAIVYAGPAPGATANVLLAATCAGNVELEATWAGAWRDADRIGLGLNVEDAEGYLFVLQSGAAKPEAAVDPLRRPLGTAERPMMAIYRNGVLLREERWNPGPDDAGLVRLLARREGSRLTFEINGRSSIVFHDLFPVRAKTVGRYGLLWPPGASVRSLRASRQNLPSAPSDLEQGDDQYARGNYTAAAESYARQAAAAKDAEIHLEARYKHALCMVELGRTDEALRIFQVISAESGEGWPTRALVQVWRLHLLKGQTAEVEAVSETISSRYGFDRLVSWISDAERRAIMNNYFRENSGLNFADYSLTRARDLQRAVRANRLFGRTDEGYSSQMEQALFRTYFATGQNDQAAQLAEDCLSRSFIGKDQLVDEYAWLLCCMGKPTDALRVVNRALNAPPDGYQGAQRALLLARARAHVAMGNWAEAEKDVQSLLEEIRQGNVQGPYFYYADARLLEGFLHERRGDEKGAIAAWTCGYQKVGEEGMPGEGKPGESYARLADGGMRTLRFALLGSLSGRIPSQEVELVFARISGGPSAGTSLRLMKVIRMPNQVFDAARTMCATKRGREVARHVAYRDVPFAEVVAQPVSLVGYEFAASNVFGNDLSPAQEEVLWRTARETFEAQRTGGLNAIQATQMAMAYKGTTNLFGWQGLSATLGGPLGAKISYVMGKRYLNLSRPGDARGMFAQAVALAGDDGQLRTLAQAELTRLSPTTAPRP